jgi:monoamine oxidase
VCQRLVVTVPLNILKQNLINFTPAMPSTFNTSINRRDMGLLDGVVLQFNSIFWDDNAKIARVTTPAGNYQEAYNAALFVYNNVPVWQWYLSTDQAEAMEAKTDAQVSKLSTCILSVAQWIFFSFA